jgi:hypothetical protein
MSAVIGAIFTVIVFLAGFSFILWEVGQYDSHQQVINDRNRADQDQKNEILEIIDPSIQSTRLLFSVTNKGSVTGHVVNLWFTEYNGTTALRHIGPMANSTYINSGATVSFNITFASINPELSYLIKVSTERGNEVTKMLNPNVEPGTGGDLNIGPFVLIFSDQSFRYTSDMSLSPPPSDVATPQNAFQIDNDQQRILFWIQIKNQAGRSIQLSQQSFFLVEVRQLAGDGEPGSTEYERYFHVVGPASTYSSLQAYTPDYLQTIHPGETATLKFGAETVHGTAFLNPEGEYQPLQGDLDNGNFYENLCWTFLVLFWKYEGEANTFGQTIAYVAIRTLA